MEPSSAGIHHVTAICGDPQTNIDFYAGTLGLRLVKLTVNFDDPTSYHLYYGDDLGRPGSIMTFFAWPGARRGRQGVGQVAVTSFAVPRSALGHWVERLLQSGVAYEGPTRRFDEQVLAFKDPDGLLLEIVASDRAESLPPRQTGPVSGTFGIRGIHGVTLWEGDAGPTGETLTGILGFRPTASPEAVTRFEAADGSGSTVDVRAAGGFWGGMVAVGTVHHVAWRADDDDAQLALRRLVEERGLHITPVLDRKYFRSVYFREPGGVLFEIATDPPGFTVDESIESLGTSLQLPPWFEPDRAAIAAALPPVQLPRDAHAPQASE